MPPFSKKKRRSVYPVLLHEEDATKERSYINLTILDASEAVYGMVHSKMQEQQKNLPGPSFLKDKVAHKLAKTASKAVPPKEIVKALSQKLPKMLMYKMYHEMGMRMAAQAVYREDCYAVIQIQVQYVDSKRLLDKARTSAGGEGGEAKEDDDDDSVATAVLDEWIDEQKKLVAEEQQSPFVTEAQNTEEEPQLSLGLLLSNWREFFVLLLSYILNKLMPVHITRDLEENRLPAIIQAKISENMKGMLDQKLASKNLKAVTAVLGEAEQARYFYSHLQKVRKKTVGTEAETTATGGAVNETVSIRLEPAAS